MLRLSRGRCSGMYCDLRSGCVSMGPLLYYCAALQGHDGLDYKECNG